jgi:hypothetical protein
MCSGFVAHVDRIIVAGDLNFGELNDGLLCAGWRDAYQKHCQHEESQWTDWQPFHGDSPLFLRFSRNFRFGFLTRASYVSPAPDTTNLPPEQIPARSARLRRLVFARLASPACCRVIDFSDTAPTLLPQPHFATAIGVLPAPHRQSPDPSQHLAKQPPVQMSLGQQQPVVPGLLDQLPASLHQPLVLAPKSYRLAIFHLYRYQSRLRREAGRRRPAKRPGCCRTHKPGQSRFPHRQRRDPGSGECWGRLSASLEHHELTILRVEVGLPQGARETPRRLSGLYAP